MSTIAIVVTYNGAQWVDRCFGSLRASTVPVLAVVVDNGSTDGTLEAITTRFPEVEVVRAGRNLGFGQANNLGLRLAIDRGADHAFLLNQDAWVLPGTVEQLIAASSRGSDFGILSPLHVNGPGDALDRYFAECIAPVKCPDLFSDMVLGIAKNRPYPVDFVNAAAWLITRRCLTTVGGFSPSFFHYGEDDNYVARLRHHGLRIGVLPTTRIHHDRSKRGANPYFDDRVLLLTRRTLLTYSDPRIDQNLTVDRREWWRKLLQGLAFGRLLEVRTARERLRILGGSEVKEAIANRMITRVAGPTFL